METTYRDLSYESGKAIHRLRNRIGLTQAGLAEHLGVSPRTIREWEAGGSYLKTERLKALVVLAIEYRAFPQGSEAAEIRELWKTTRQKRLIDEDLIAESDERPSPELDDARRRYYRLTSLGRRVLTAESERLEDLVRVIRAKRRIVAAES